MRRLVVVAAALALLPTVAVAQQDQKYTDASAIGFATIPNQDPGGLSIAAVNRMITGAITGAITGVRRREAPAARAGRP